jgi:hypothetical protein
MQWQEPAGSFINDIALFKGKLYILTTEAEHNQHELHMLDLWKEQRTIRSNPRADDGYDSWYNPYSTDNYVQRNYLVASGDRLLMVELGSFSRQCSREIRGFRSGLATSRSLKRLT